MAAVTTTTCFSTKRLNHSTFLITEDDSYREHPFIYAKLHSKLPLLILSDTGCNSPRDSSVEVKSLRQYIEMYPIPANDGKPLNPIGSDGKAEREYMVICTHCHYDHIGGIEQFSVKSPNTACASILRPVICSSNNQTRGQATIVASSYCRPFLMHNLATHSLCKFLRIPLPRYKVTQWAKDDAPLYWRGNDTGITIFHTPGHTPDELAWFDEEERWLYVGDSFYERGVDKMPIIFPKEGNWKNYTASLSKLLQFVRRKNSEVEDKHDDDWLLLSKRIQLGCGHSTSTSDAEEIIETVQYFFQRIISGQVPVKSTTINRDEVCNLWEDAEPSPRFSVFAPARLAGALNGSSGTSF
ncbi:Metallo-hydrolase/oxidoreductase [Glonium stellatum]|uniref:Metallo-hydrolase/oxidoreductase n=1 Tax=Glonium stellatum TaxID=574774 RepID=A0A8E2EZW7_9PEZI|nr:Metallo-hydrolase/oxidoreductase [Glonium stellatum]